MRWSHPLLLRPAMLRRRLREENRKQLKNPSTFWLGEEIE